MRSLYMDWLIAITSKNDLLTTLANTFASISSKSISAMLSPSLNSFKASLDEYTAGGGRGRVDCELAVRIGGEVGKFGCESAAGKGGEAAILTSRCPF
jgi:hypothetical protein